MTYVKIEMVNYNAEEKAAVAEAMTEATVKHTGERPESVWTDVQRDDWATAGTGCRAVGRT